MRNIILLLLISSVCFAQTSLPTNDLITLSGTNSYTGSHLPNNPLVNGLSYRVKFTNTNTTTCTLNITGSAIALTRADGTALSAGDINAGTDGFVTWVQYDASVSKWKCYGVSGNSFVTSVTGTTNRITSTGGTTPVIDISSSYVGQGSITTLGTIGTGTWNGSVIGLTYGGLGSAFSDPGANKLIGWDDTDNTNGYWTLGSGLSYNHGTHTISTTGGLSGLTSGRIPYATSSTTIGDDGYMIYDPSNHYAGIAGIFLYGTGSSLSSNSYIGNGFNFTTSGTGNIRFGNVSGSTGLSSGSNNLTIGHNAGFNLSTGSTDILIGHQAGDNLSTGSNNIIIGANAIDFASNTASNQLNIQNIIWGINNSGTGTTASTGQIGIGINAPTSTLHINGSFETGYVAKTGTYTATISDYTINCTSGTFTVTLPTAVGIAGRLYVISNSGAGTITIGTTSSQNFANVVATPTTLTMSVVGARTVQSDGANWILISSL